MKLRLSFTQPRNYSSFACPPLMTVPRSYDCLDLSRAGRRFIFEESIPTNDLISCLFHSTVWVYYKNRRHVFLYIVQQTTLAVCIACKRVKKFCSDCYTPFSISKDSEIIFLSAICPQMELSGGWGSFGKTVLLMYVS